MNSKKIEGVRALNEFLAMTHSVSSHRVAIIFDAHDMNINSQNALLKTLEELPENKHIFLVSNTLTLIFHPFKIDQLQYNISLNLMP